MLAAGLHVSADYLATYSHREEILRIENTYLLQS